MAFCNNNKMVSLVVVLVLALVACQLVSQVESCRNRTETARLTIERILSAYPQLKPYYSNTATTDSATTAATTAATSAS